MVIRNTMKNSLTKNTALFQLFLWPTCFLIALSACSTNSSGVTPTPTEDFLSVSELFAEDDGAGEPGDTNKTPTPVATPTQIAPEEILIVWESSENLDSVHRIISSQDADCQAPLLDDGTPILTCCGCHQFNADNTVTIPEDETCLTCHGGTHGGLGNLTNDYMPFNPHDYHYTLGASCVMCHVVHESLEEPCGLCHENIEVYRPE